MSPLQLLATITVLAAVTAQSAALPSSICRLIAGEADPSFERFTVSGRTQCRCESTTASSCQQQASYPTVAPNSPEALLNEYHRPTSSAMSALLAYQIQVTCRSMQAQGRRCLTTWPSDGSGAPVCDCATADGAVSIRAPYFIDHIRSRAGLQNDEEAKQV